MGVSQIEGPAPVPAPLQPIIIGEDDKAPVEAQSSLEKAPIDDRASLDNDTDRRAVLADCIKEEPAKPTVHIKMEEDDDSTEDTKRKKTTPSKRPGKRPKLDEDE